MRTFPRCLATFREIVNQRGAHVRSLSFEDLRGLNGAPLEHLILDRRKATIGFIVEPRPDGSLLVVIQGFMDGRLLPFIKNVALDGFYKYPDGRLAPMPQQEFYRFD